ncbi:MAG TPA: hypothetical protein VGC86_14715 [Afipia sp.]
MRADIGMLRRDLPERLECTLGNPGTRTHRIDTEMMPGLAQEGGNEIGSVQIVRERFAMENDRCNSDPDTIVKDKATLENLAKARIFRGLV